MLILIEGRHCALRRRTAQSRTCQCTLPSAALRQCLDAAPVRFQQQSLMMCRLMHAVVVRQWPKHDRAPNSA